MVVSRGIPRTPTVRSAALSIAHRRAPRGDARSLVLGPTQQLALGKRPGAIGPALCSWERARFRWRAQATRRRLVADICRCQAWGGVIARDGVDEDLGGERGFGRRQRAEGGQGDAEAHHGGGHASTAELGGGSLLAIG